MNPKILRVLKLTFIFLWPFFAAHGGYNEYFGLHVPLKNPYTEIVLFAVAMLPGLAVINLPFVKDKALDAFLYSSAYVVVFFPLALLYSFVTGCYFRDCPYVGV